MSKIKDREDVNKLVVRFYEVVRKDSVLGPIFNAMIPEERWPAHLEKLTDFWETNLFGVRRFKGNPVEAHQRTDRMMNYGITQEHFGRWLQLWFQTIDSLYSCERARRAKDSARRMATGQFMVMWHARPESVISGS